MPAQNTDLRQKVSLGRTGLQVSRMGLASSYGIGRDGVQEAYETWGVNYFYWGSRRMKSFGEGIRRLALLNRENLVIVIQSQPPFRAGRRSENARQVISTDEEAIRKPLSYLIHWGDTTLSEGGFLQTGDELNATDMFFGQPVVVGNEQLHFQSCRTGQLDGIRWANASVLPHVGIIDGGSHIERDNRQTWMAEKGAVAILQINPVGSDRLHQDLAHCQATGAQLISPRHHRAPDLLHSANKLRVLFK